MSELTEEEKKQFRAEEDRWEQEQDRKWDYLEPTYKEWKSDNIAELQKEFIEQYSAEFEDFCLSMFSEIKR